jgi:Uma2 family endonuclease
MTVTAELIPTVADPVRGESREFHWTTDLFYRAADAGVFAEPSRLELIHGRIIEKMPQSPLHRAARIRVSRVLRTVLEPAFTVAEECPIHIAFDGEPVPDIVVLRGTAAEDIRRHPVPDEVALLVEVAVSSLDSDIGEKAVLYAQAGIADYWVVVPEAAKIIVHRKPTPDGYASVTTFGQEDVLAPLAAPEAVCKVREMLGEGISAPQR